MQKTLKQTINFSGIALHSGKNVAMKLSPAMFDNGITLSRTDIKTGGNTIRLSWQYVVPSELCTLLAWEDENGEKITVSTVEHILSALRGAGVDNAHIDLDGPEVPIMDGSAIEFYNAIMKAGLEAQKAPSRYIRILKDVVYEEGEKWAKLSPASLPSFEFELDFEAGAIGRQSAKAYLLNGNYAHDIAPARTFCTKDTVDWMRARGLALGGALDNAVVFDGDNVLNPEGLRFENEPARHKMLDAIGDLYLAGAPILGAFSAYKAGHAMHTALLTELFSDPSNYEWVGGEIEDLPAVQAIYLREQRQRVLA